MEMVEDKDRVLYLQLHKLSALNSEEALEQLLSALWNTRKTGIHSPDQNSHFQSLLNLPSLSQLHPVLACLRSLIRKWVRDENFTGDDLLKLFPPDLPLDLQTSLLRLFHKYQPQWKAEAANEQRLLPTTSVSYQVKTNVPPSFTAVGISGAFNGFGALTTPIVSAANAPHLASMSPPFPNLVVLPRLKSMTWTMENTSSGPVNRVAVISLKLQDYNRSPLDETEVKFQLTRDTLEAMIRSLTYIKEQLSSMVGTTSGPSQKKQKQTENLV